MWDQTKPINKNLNKDFIAKHMTRGNYGGWAIK